MTTINRIDLSPPIGYGKGLPFTLPFHLSGSWETVGNSLEYIDADDTLWDQYPNTKMGKTYSATWSSGVPVYDSVKGYLWTSQIINGQAPAPGSTDAQAAFTSYAMAVGLTYSMPGRTRGYQTLNAFSRSGVTDDPILFQNASVGDGGGPPGNHTHQIGPVEQTSTAMLIRNSGHNQGNGGYGRMFDRATNNLTPVIHDTAVGTKLSIFSNSESACVAYHSQVCLPSGGNGRQWGDSHDTIYNVTLGASAFGVHTHPTYSDEDAIKGLTSSRWSIDANFKDPVHWCINLYTHGNYPFNRLPRTGTYAGGGTTSDNPSSPPGIGNFDIEQTVLGDGTTEYQYHKHDMANWTQPTETVQTILVHEKIGTVSTVRELGPAHLGNHAVMDATGLVGFEGSFIVSAFFGVSQDTERDGVTSPAAHSYSQGMHFSGLNIQVVSGTPSRRAGGKWLPTGMRGTRYGSDGTMVAPLSDAMITTGSMKNPDGTLADQDTNRTSFHTGRMGMDTATELGNSFGSRTHIVKSGESTTTVGTGSICQQYIVGDTEALAAAFSNANTPIGTTAMIGTEKVGTRWMMDYVPTKVRVIPSVVGFEEKVVTPGSAKETAYSPQTGEPIVTGNITFKQPIVDYHVLVSLTEKTGNITAAATEAITTRNAPDFTDLTFDGDYSDSKCVIMHAIFRVNPTTLEQVYTGNANLDFGSPRTGFAYSKTNGFDQVMPRHDYTYGDRQGWGLHQVTPFRPIRSQQWDEIPTFSMIESGGMYQRGGISHLWDADVYGNELLVSSTLADASALGGGTPTTDSRTGKNWFGPVWKYGQAWDTATPQLPIGDELMVFRYTTAQDPYHPGPVQTTRTSNPIYDRFNAAGLASYIYGGFDSTLHNDGHTSAVNGLNWTTPATARREGSDGNTWCLHDWVFPRVELMRYLGAELKRPGAHPRLGCSALRIMEDGRMMMAAIHQDIITASDQYPDSSIGYPTNPDNSYPRCPPGFYYDGTACVPMTGASADPDGGLRYDPDSESTTSKVAPTPSTPPSAATPNNPGSTAFGEFPTYTKLIANSGARSLVLLWTDTKAKNGKVQSGRCDFSGSWISDHAGGWTWNQTFNLPDTWWSGARISYWYPESGQRAIPCVYGLYPEVRLSNVTLPRSMPARLMDTVIEGYPLQQHVGRTSTHTIGHLYGHSGSGYATTEPTLVFGQSTTQLPTEWTKHQTWLKRQHFVPTIYGFTDFISGAKPYFAKGWGSWALPAGLIDPAVDPGGLFPNEGGSAQENIQSTFNQFMGILPGVDWTPGSGGFVSSTLDDLQATYMAWDFGQFERYPKKSTITNKGSITGVITSTGLVSITAVPVDTLADIETWIRTGTDSPFTDQTTYGIPVVEASRVLLPVTINSSSDKLGTHTGIRIDIDSAGGGDEGIIIEPCWIQPRNLIDPATFNGVP